MKMSLKLESKIVNEIVSTLFSNNVKISEELWAPNLDGWKIWICGRLGSNKITFSNPISGGTSPNPTNYDVDEWIIEEEYWTDIPDMDQEEIDEAEKNNEISDIILNQIDVDALTSRAFFPNNKEEE